MNLLSPWFLAGLALAAAPFIAHLIRRATRDRYSFSAVRFLEESPPRLDRRSRVQHPWLLALRILIVAVLALGFARPYLPNATAPATAAADPRHRVILLDRSASLQRADLWPAAREQVETLARELGPGDLLSVLTAGATIEPLISFDQWQSLAPTERISRLHGALAQTEPGWGPFPLDDAVEDVLGHWEGMAERHGQPGRAELIIVSDFASGTRTAGLAGISWPPGATVRPVSIGQLPEENATLQFLGWITQPDGTLAARLRVSRSFDTSEPLTWQAFRGDEADPLRGVLPDLDLLPGGQQIVTLPWPDGAAEAIRLELRGDRHPFDNQLWLARPLPRNVPLLYAGANRDADDPAHAPFYLARAVAGIAEPKVTFSPLAEAATVPTSAVIVAELPLPDRGLDPLRQHLAAGGTVLVLNAAGSATALDDLQQLTGQTGWSATVPERDDAMLASIDFQHALFAPFADPRFSDFTRVRFWQPRGLQPPDNAEVQVLARFDDGSPAVVEQAVGPGTLVVWAPNWSRDAGQWVLSSKFVPWLHALVERAAGGTRPPSVAEVGAASRLAGQRGDERWAQLAGTQTSSAAAGLPQAPGWYRLSGDASARTVALNVPAAESQLAPLGMDVWDQLGVPLAAAAPAIGNESGARHAAARQLEHEQQWWRTLLWAALALLALESLLSLVLSRRTANGTPATA